MPAWLSPECSKALQTLLSANLLLGRKSGTLGEAHLTSGMREADRPCWRYLPAPLHCSLLSVPHACSTAKLAKQAGARVILAQRGRARQMNAGAEIAQGDLLCFMHADSRIPRYSAAAVA